MLSFDVINTIAIYRSRDAAAAARWSIRLAQCQTGRYGNSFIRVGISSWRGAPLLFEAVLYGHIKFVTSSSSSRSSSVVVK